MAPHGGVLGSAVHKERGRPEGAPRQGKPLRTAYLIDAPQSINQINTDPGATVHPFPRDRRTLKQKAAQRLRELSRLAALREREGFCHSDHVFAWAIAQTLGVADRGFMLIKRSPRPNQWDGLDMETLRKHVSRFIFLWDMSDAELWTVIEDVERGYKRYGRRLAPAAFMGAKLLLTKEERLTLKIRTIDAYDQTTAARKIEVAERRRERDKEAKRVQRGATPRPLYEERSLSQQKPWEEEGISRRTWYRKRKMTKSDDT